MYGQTTVIAHPSLETKTRRSRYSHMPGSHRWLVLGALCAVLSAPEACGTAPQVSRVTPSSAASQARTSPTARSQSGPPLAILVHSDAPLQSDTPSPAMSYYVALVAADGTTVAKANPRVPSAVAVTYQVCPRIGPVAPCDVQIRPRAPLVTSSNTRAYFLDGDSDVGYMTLDGKTGTAVHLPSNPRIRYAVAVSPDDSRIAVAALEYLGTVVSGQDVAIKLNIFIQDLAGGARVDLFSSTSVTEWPIGWHDGHLLVAVGPSGLVQYTSDNPYYANEYHVANATTGDRLATIGGDCLYGPVVRGGAPCMFSEPTQNILGYRSWDGVRHSFVPQPDPNLQPLALAPNGSKLAGTSLGPPTNSHLALISASGITPLGAKGILQGWLDDEHIVYFEVGSNRSFILDLVTGVSAAVPQTNPPGLPDVPNAYLHFLGTVPQQMS